jgi:hypothetical protein
MSAFKLHTLKQKLWAIVVVSFIARVVAFFVLPNTPSSIAPDEGTYADLAKWVGESKPVDVFPSYGPFLYLSGRTLIVPASFLYRIGFNELDAVRLISSLYGLSALILVVALILKLYKGNMADSLNGKFNNLRIIGLVTIFAFMPSHFIWSNLGLRESATEFWILATFAIFFMLFHFKKTITAQGIMVLVASIAFTFSSRPQVGWVIGVSLIAFLLFNLNQIYSYFMIPLVICGVLLGTTWNQGSTTWNQGSTTASTGSTTASTGSTTAGKRNLGEIFSPLTNVGEVVSSKQQVNQLGAASVIETQSCPKDTPTLTSTPSTKFDTYFCIAWRAPYMVSTFLFRPVLGVDVTSTSSLIAAIENLLWFILFITIIALGIRRRSISFFAPILPTFIFFALYVLGASAYQGNMGTGFRHKSLILWAVLLLIFALGWRKPEESVKECKNNSQESAV